MLFNSYAFLLVFLPCVLAGFYLLCRAHLVRGAVAWLLTASLAFYAYWDYRFLLFLLASILGNYLLGAAIERTRRKELAVFAVSANLLVLGYYKYTNFLLQAVGSATGVSIVSPEIIMPLGISFFTFTQIAYLIDAYRGETKGYGLVDYSLFVTFFPHLIAGPILYHKDVIPQFSQLRNFRFDARNMSMGVALFAIGLFKKAVIADSMIDWVHTVFTHIPQLTFIEAWLGALAYALQLYFDFSGYSDMAIGLGWMLNIRLPVNFNSPYKATSIIQFWNRWHMTLLTFFYNYLFVSLGGNRRGYWTGLRNVMIVMLVSGLWHGAGWTYILWGGLNGVYLVINHTWRKYGLGMPVWLAWPVTFTAVVAGMALFRSPDLTAAGQILAIMFGLKGITLPASYAPVLGTSLGWLISFADLSVLTGDRLKIILTLTGLLLAINVMPNTNQWMKRFEPNWSWTLVTVLLVGISLLHLHRITEFLYFQF